MFKKILRLLGKLHIIKMGSYKVKGDMNKLIKADVASQTSVSWFYGDVEKEMKKWKKKKKKDTWKNNTPSRLKQKIFIGIGVILSIYAVWFLIDTLIAWPAWRSLTDFVIIIFFAAFGVLCLPFSYARQEKYRWKNITQISIGLLAVFLILSFSTVSIVSDIFSWDTFSFWWIIYVVIIIFLRSLFLPRTLLRRQHTYKAFDVLKRRYGIFGIFIVVSGIVLLVDVSWSSDSSIIENDDGTYSERQHCLGAKQTPQGDARLQVSFVTSSDENMQVEEVDQRVFSVEKLATLQLSIEWALQEDTWWSNWEICEMNMNTVLVPGDIEEYDSNMILPWSWWRWKVSNTIELEAFTIPSGNYAVNVFFSSHDSWPWKLSKQLTFSVE